MADGARDHNTSPNEVKRLRTVGAYVLITIL